MPGAAGETGGAPSPPPDPPLPDPPEGAPGPTRRWIRHVVTYFTGTDHRTAAWGLLFGAISALAAVVALALAVWNPDDDGSAAQPTPVARSATPSSDKPDLYVTTRMVPNDSRCLALPKAPASLAERVELTTRKGALSAVARKGGVAVGQFGVDITLQGGQRALTVESIDIVPRTPKPAGPADGALLCWLGQGDVPKVKLAANMDQADPYLYDKGSPERPHFSDNVITLAPQEQVSVRAFFQAKREYREFELVVRYTVEGERESMTVPPPSGDAYAVTGPSDTYSVGYTYSMTGSVHEMSAREMCDYSGRGKSC